jgi:GNAT superfamily N-acetyltransferase
MRAIEIAAGQLFLSVDMPDIAADDPPEVSLLARHIDRGTAWVAEMASGGRSSVVGYAIASIVDGAAHVDQVSVDPSAGRRGIGRLLLAWVASWAGERGIERVTLTTFRDVPWNGPYYARVGFEVVPDADVGPELRALVAEETAAGLDPSLRVCMAMSASRLASWSSGPRSPSSSSSSNDG